MTALLCTPPRSDILYARKRRAETMAQLESELIERGILQRPVTGDKIERKRAAHDRFRRVGE